MGVDERDVVAAVERLTVRRLREWVRRGWIRPVSGRRGAAFTEIDVARVRLVCHLKWELCANDDAIAVMLSLMDQVYGLRRELKALGRAIERQPADVQRRIAELMQALTGE